MERVARAASHERDGSQNMKGLRCGGAGLTIGIVVRIILILNHRLHKLTHGGNLRRAGGGGAELVRGVARRGEWISSRSALQKDLAWNGAS